MNRDTYWCCTYCGNECGAAEPATFRCCGEIGHVEERDEETGEPIDGKWTPEAMDQAAAEHEAEQEQKQ